MKKISNYVNIILIIFVIVLALCYLGVLKITSKESFESNMNNDNLLRPGKYSVSVDKPLLHGYYNVKDNTNVTKNNNYNIWEDYPVYENSYKQETNNKRYWSTPDNGLCSPAEFCGTPYSPTNIKISKVSPGFPLGAPVTRINWWATKKN
jgi:hypothetical protein